MDIIHSTASRFPGASVHVMVRRHEEERKKSKKIEKNRKKIANDADVKHDRMTGHKLTGEGSLKKEKAEIMFHVLSNQIILQEAHW